MPLSSAQIAQLNGSFTQQHMMNMQFAGMIEPHGFNVGGYNTGAQNEGLAARALNTSSAIGAPAAMLGMGMMGLDPLSMGMRAGAGAMGAGAGFGGAALAGAAAGGGMALGLGAISYMGNQVMQGMQQGQQFNQAMRSGYSFFNPNGSHGRGFSEGDIRSIGSSMRGQAGEGGFTELGPSFNELGRLASNMGRMGLADGVRNAKEFTEKFREMMKTVKTIAEDMGTSLEEAQKMMASMKGSGIFKNQAGVGNAIRGASVAGGLATTEVTSMMNAGSQISRMFGGTGKQGAMGGIRAIEQVGMAVQTGALNEEDIYQATGLTGAEGRQAMAQQQMMQTGSFLKSSKGRWLLASLAGKDGKLDQGSVNDFLTGGMSVNDTRNAAHRNLAGVGRANFIRNEGRLRGSVMEEFGGMAPAMAMMGWAQGKGIDVHSMGDREMLFMQRQLGMGRDEMDSMMKMVRAMPDMMRHRRETMQEDSSVREHGMRAQNSGLEGVKRKLEAARDKVNNEMQKAGQDILNVATDRVAAWGNRLAGTYEEHIISGVREAHRVAMMGGREGAAASASLLGGGSGKFGGLGLGGPRENFSQARYKEHVEDLQFSARLGTAGSMSSEMSGLVGSNSMAIKRAYAEELSGLGGEDRMAAFKRRFGKNTDIGKKFRAMDQREQAAFMQQMEGEIGMKSGRLSETFQVPGLPDLVGGGSARTEAERTEALGRSMLGIGKGRVAQVAEGAGGVLGAATGFMAGGVGAIAGGVLGRKAGGLLGRLSEEWNGNAKMARAAGAMLDSEEGRRTAFDVLSGAAGGEERLLMNISNLKGKAAERGGMANLTDEERGQLGFYNAVGMAADLNKAIAARGGADKLTSEDKAKLIAQKKRQVREMGGDPSSVTMDSIMKEANGVGAAASEQRDAVIRQLATQVGRDSRQEMQALRAGGIAKLVGVRTGSDGRGAGGTVVDTLMLTDEARNKLMKSGGQGAVQAAEMALAVQQLGLDASHATSPQEAAELIRKQEQMGGSLYDKMAGMDVKSLRALGSQMAGTQVGGQASEMIMRGQAIEGSKRKMGAAGAIAAQLGLQFGADELKGLKGKDAAGAAAALAARLGVGGDESFVKSLEESIAAAGQKGGGIKAGALLSRAMQGADAETKKKLEEQAKSQQSPEEKIIDKIGEGNRYLEALVKSNESAKAKLAEIAGNTRTSDGEKT
jgi:hypothetical protein